VLGTAIWAGPNPAGILRGTLGFELPERVGPFDSLLLVVGMLGAIGGSVMNLVYPYFIEQKGWRGPEYRKVQMYDFSLGIVVMIILDLAVWTLGAELMYGTGQQIHNLNDLSRLLSLALGRGGQVLFYLGVFAAVYTSIVGHALGLGLLASHSYLRWRAGDQPITSEYRSHPMYRCVAIWILLSPLVWTLPGMPDFVRLTLIGNSIQVVLVPFLAIGLFWITASSRFIGSKYRNRWWENLVMIGVLLVSLWGAYGSIRSVWNELSKESVPSAATGSPASHVPGKTDG
jgi:Mn2+/Fe2+ NRAMP family transporter